MTTDITTQPNDTWLLAGLLAEQLHLAAPGSADADACFVAHESGRGSVDVTMYDFESEDAAGDWALERVRLAGGQPPGAHKSAGSSHIDMGDEVPPPLVEGRHDFRAKLAARGAYLTVKLTEMFSARFPELDCYAACEIACEAMDVVIRVHPKSFDDDEAQEALLFACHAICAPLGFAFEYQHNFDGYVWQASYER